MARILALGAVTLLGFTTTALAQLPPLPTDMLMSRGQLHALLAKQFPDLDKALGLTREQTTEFANFVIDEAMRGMASTQQAQLEVDARFGNGMYAKWRNVVLLRPGNQFVQAIAPEFERGGVPLDDRQRARLASAFVEVVRGAPTPSSDALVRRAGDALSARQLELLRSAVEARNASATEQVSGGGAAQATEAQRRQLIDSFRSTMGDGASFLRLNATKIQRLCELLADRQLAFAPAGNRIVTTAMIGPGQTNTALNAAFSDAIAKEFGEAVAERWKQYQTLRLGLMSVDMQLLKYFYNADQPLTSAQRLQLAASWQGAQTAVTQTTTPSLPASDGSVLAAIAGTERSLAMSESRNARILSEARAYLDKGRLEILFAALDAPLVTQRDSLRRMRDAAIAQGGDAARAPAPPSAPVPAAR